MTNCNIYKTIVIWPNGGIAWFYTKTDNNLEAETIVNFLLHRDYNWEGTKMNTVSSLPPNNGTVYYLDSSRVKSYETKEK